MPLKQLLLALFAMTSFASMYAMEEAINNAINQNLNNPRFQALIANAILTNAQNPQLKAVFGDVLIRNAPRMALGVITDPDVLVQLGQIKNWFNAFAAAAPEDTKNLLTVVKQEVLDFLTDKAGWGFQQFQAFRKKHKDDGMVGKALDFIESVLWRKTFPISGDPQLKDGFTLQDWSSACYQGYRQIIQAFLRNDAYAHLLNAPDGENRGLSNAAFGYIGGEEIGGVIPSVEGFTALVRDPRIESNFLIKAALTSIPFDEWLLYQASYPHDAGKQARLNELRPLLEATLGQDRLDALRDIRDRKESERKAQERLIADKKAYSFNKASALVGALATAAGIYYFYHYSKNGAPAVAVQSGRKAA